MMHQGDIMISVEDVPTIFNDLSPIPQNDGPDRVCVIQYPGAFRVAYNYMRAVWVAKEYSRRGLKLSATCLKMNPANYTVWNYRRQCLQSLGLRLDKTCVQNDLELTSALGGSNPKNYQIWYHRRALLEMYGPSEFLDEELNYINGVLVEDSKNYHAWSYRQWILLAVDEEPVWRKEMEFVRDLIQEDIYNNSAWNQRWFVSHRGKQQKQQQPLIGINAARQEADFAISHGAMLDPYNESPWRYLIGILQEQHRLCYTQKQQNNDNMAALIKRMIAEYEAKINSDDIRNVMIDANRNPDMCVHMTNARIDLLEMIDTEDSLQMAITLAGGLATKFDTIRKKYWLLVSERMKRRINSKRSN